MFNQREFSQVAPKYAMDSILNNAVKLEQVNGHTLRAPNANKRRVEAYLHNLTLLFKQQDTVWFLRKRLSRATTGDFFRTRTSTAWGKAPLRATRDTPDFRTITVQCANNKTLRRENQLWRIRGVFDPANPGTSEDVMVFSLWEEWALDVGMRAPSSFTDAQLAEYLRRFAVWQLNRPSAPLPQDIVEKVYAKNEFLVHLCISMCFRRVTEIAVGDSKTITRRKLLSRHRQIQRSFPRGLWSESSVADRVGWGVFPVGTSVGMTSTYPSTRAGTWWDAAMQADDLLEQPLPNPVPALVPVNWNTVKRPKDESFREILFARRLYRNDPVEVLVFRETNAPQDSQDDIVFLGLENSEWVGKTPDMDLTRSRETVLPRVRRGVTLTEARKAVPSSEPYLDENDAYEQLLALYGRKSTNLFQHAGLLGTQFHNGVTRVLMHGKQLYASTCGMMSVNLIRQDGRAVNPETKRLERAKDALMIRAFPPLPQMVYLMLKELSSYVSSMPDCGSFSVVFTEYPVWFPYVLSAGVTAGTKRGKVYESAVDAVIRYTAPPATNRTGPRQTRMGMVEFKTIYGEQVSQDVLPLKDHVVQAVLQAFMLQETASFEVDRVFLVYATRHKRIGIFNIPFAPHAIEWQRDCVLEWLKGLGNGHYYFDRRHFTALSVVVNNVPPFETDLRNALTMPFSQRRALSGGTVPRVGRSTVIEHTQNVAVTVEQVPLDTLDFERRGAPQAPVSMPAQALYGKTIQQLSQMAISGQREYPDSETQAHRAARGALRGSIQEFVGSLDLSESTAKRLHQELNARMGQPQGVDFETEYQNTQDTTDLRKTVLVRAIQRQLNRMWMRTQYANSTEVSTLAHCNQKALMPMQGLAYMQNKLDKIKPWAEDAAEAARF